MIMAKKDTVKALIKRGVSEEDAMTLIGKFNTMGAIGESSIDAIAEPGIPEDRAEAILKAIHAKPSSSSSSSRAKKVAVQEPEPVQLFETYAKFSECDAAEKKL